MIVQDKPVIPNLKVNVEVEWGCMHCKTFNRSKGYIELDIVSINCSTCRQPVKIDCRLAFDKRGL